MGHVSGQFIDDVAGQEVAEGHELAQASRRDRAVDGGILEQGPNLGRKGQAAVSVDVVHGPEAESIVNERQPLALAVPGGDGKAAVHTFEEAMALELTVRTLRHAQGKKNPEDVLYASPEWDVVSEEFVRDLYRAMGGNPAELP